MTYGQKLRIIRTVRGLTQRELSRATGISQAMISAIELDAIEPLGSYREKLEAALNWPQYADQAFALLES